MARRMRKRARSSRGKNQQIVATESSILWSSEPTFFFFQAEDGIRDYKVTGVQTCALPIWVEAREIFVGGVTGFPGAGGSVSAMTSRIGRPLRSDPSSRMVHVGPIGGTQGPEPTLHGRASWKGTLNSLARCSDHSTEPLHSVSAKPANDARAS